MPAILSSIEPGEWFAFLGWLIATLMSIYVYVSTVRARTLDRRFRTTTEQASRIDAQMVSWGINCIESLAAAHILAATYGSGKPPEDVRARRDEIQSRISGLVDAGRLYFINRSPDLVGTDRNYANQGYRPAILDSLMLVHEELRRIDLTDRGSMNSAASNIFGARQIFVSILRTEVDSLRDPDWLRQMREKDDNWTEVSKLVDVFESRHGTGSFWKDRPRSRAEIKASISTKRARAH